VLPLSISWLTRRTHDLWGQNDSGLVAEGLLIRRSMSSLPLRQANCPSRERKHHYDDWAWPGRHRLERPVTDGANQFFAVIAVTAISGPLATAEAGHSRRLTSTQEKRLARASPVSPSELAMRIRFSSPAPGAKALVSGGDRLLRAAQSGRHGALAGD